MTKKLILLLCFVFAFAAVTMTADTWDKKTTLTFSRPVELPTMTLPAGTYVFKLSELGNRHLVMVYNAEETMLFTQILAIPNWQLTPKGETVLRFAERPKTQPEALRAWFYPGDNFGQEFVYPKRKALALAEETKAPVLAAEITPEETPEQLAQEPVVAVTPEKKEVEVAQVIPPAPPEIAQAAPAPEAAPKEELPATGSPYPWIAVIGIAALALGGVTKLAAKRL
jgi:LPXTG-motif cell wall-anchored protein